MKTYIDCIPCFYRQAIDASRLAGLDDSKTKIIIDKIGKLFAESILDMTPPEMAGLIHSLIKKESNTDDFYKSIKNKSNELALSVYKLCKDKIEESNDRLLTAVEMAIAGNIIDFGVKNNINIEKELENILKKENRMIKNINNNFFAYSELVNNLVKSKTIVFLADNAGETVFDRILIEELKNLYSGINIIYAVKEKPIINDALIEDAIKCGIDKYAEVVSSGSVIPGTNYNLLSADFMNKYKKADMVISKGQGNFESFMDMTKPVFYFFMAKCPMVAKETGCEIGSINLYYNKVSL
jgi:hypothetical protein